MSHLLKLRYDIDLADILSVLAPESEAVRWCILDIGEVAPLLEPYREWSDHESVVDSPTGLELSLAELTAFTALGHQVIDGIFVGFTGSAPRRDDDDAAIIACAEILAAVIDSSFWLIGGPTAVLERVSAAFGPVEQVAPDRYALSVWGRD